MLRTANENLIVLKWQKWGKNEKDFEPSILFEAQKYYFVFESKLNFFFKWSYLQSCFNVAQRCENRR